MRGKTLGWWVVHALTAVTIGGAFFLSVQLDPSDTHRIRFWRVDAPRYGFWLSVGVVCAIAAWVLQTWYNSRAARRAEERRQQQEATAAADRETLTAQAVSLGTAIVGPVTLLASILGELGDKPRVAKLARAEILGRAKVTVLDGLLSVFPDDVQARTCIFELEGVAPDRQLVSSDSRGRTPGTRRVFEEGTKAGDDALQALDRSEIRHWALGQEGDPPPGWDESRGYRAFISVPVATKGKVYGMLTVDAARADAFTIPQHLEVVEAIARLYAAALNSG